MAVRSRKRTFVQALIFFAVFLFFFKGWYIVDGISYVKLIVNAIYNEHQRQLENYHLMSQMEWDHYQLQIQHMEKICESKGVVPKDYTWMTALVNDEYVLPAVVLGHSIRTLSCIQKMLVLVSDEVSRSAKNALSKVGWQVRVVTAMDCSWMERKLGRSPTGRGIIGTHTRFHAWNYTEYSKIIYADPDYMLLSNIDELFDIPADFAATYCSRPGIVDPCFNAGLLVFRPNHKDYESIMNFWHTFSVAKHCPNDQLLLWHFYAVQGRWKPLPFAYNVRRLIHHPMKAFHFACCPPPKPWKDQCRPSRDEARSYDKAITIVRDVALVYWKNFYKALKVYHIDDWWRSTKYYNADIEFGNQLYRDCWMDENI